MDETKIMCKLEELEDRLKRIEKLLKDPTLDNINDNLHIIAAEIRSLKPKR
jgi:hypothetical protein